MEAIKAFAPSFNNLWNTVERLNEEEIPDAVLYGTIRGLIENFRGKVEVNEAVTFKRGNRSNSLLIVNRYGQEVGYLQTELAKVLCKLLEQRKIQFKGATPFGSEQQISNTLAVDITIWGVKNEKIETLKKLSKLKAYLNIVVNPTESEEDIKQGILYYRDQWYITFSGNRFENLKEEGLELDRLFESLTEGKKDGIAEPPKTISTPLHRHQKQALFWMKERESGKLLPPFWEYRDGAYFNQVTLCREVSRPPSVRGGILADDMGLGKTLTMIALIMADREEHQEEVWNDDEMDTEHGESSNSREDDSEVILIEEGSQPPVILINSDESDDEFSEVILIDSDDSDNDLPEVISIDSDEDKEWEENINDEIIELDDHNYFHRADSTKMKENTPRYTRHFPTLIVAPLSILSVWQAQLLEHVRDPFHLKILLFHHENENRYNRVLSEQDIVITTYGTVRSDFNGVNALQGVNWFRIVLDEGHKIKNPDAQCSKAICNLLSERKWIISGTPIQNKIGDLFSMITFLNIDTFNDYERWERVIETPLKFGDISAKRRLYKLMSTIALRRTKGTKIDGKRLVDLPEKSVRVKYLEFSKNEKEIYNIEFQEYKNRICRFIERGMILEEFRYVCRALVRLRQLCCHPSLINLHSQDFSGSLMGYVNYLVEQNQYTKHLISFLRFPLNECSICLQTPDSPIITVCKHVFCKNCILQHMSQNGSELCPNCRKQIQRESFYEIPPDQIELRLKKPELDTWIASTKTTAFLYDLIKLREDDPREKVLVVSEFTKLLDLLEPPLRNLNFNFVRFDGTMTQKARARVIEVFSSRNENSPTVMLLSLKAGGEGISLVAAARIFLLTPHWNPAAEEQCFDRCHRFGQTKDVLITKYVVKDSIEERIIALQEQKRKLADCAFNFKKNSTRLNIHELRTLFDL